MLATFTLERDLLQYSDIPGMWESWLFAVGTLAAIALGIWLLATLLRSFGIVREPAEMGGKSISEVEGKSEAITSARGGEFRLRGLLGCLVLGYVIAVLPNVLRLLYYHFGVADLVPIKDGPTIGAMTSTQRWRLFTSWYTFYGLLFGFAVAAVCWPLLMHLGRLRWRRIWALALLTYKEAWRRKVLWVFSLLIVVFLFLSWFTSTKPEDQLRTYVQTVFYVMTLLLLLTAGLLASFGLPADLQNQTIHTIVTKPVERFEIIIGRFLGYTFLMTLVLIGMSAFSLVYVARGLTEEAKEETYKARVPIYGMLFTQGGKNVGYEWEYRTYISGDTRDDYARWTFPSVPSSFGQRANDDKVRCEFTFDIFRTTKGVENEGVLCSFMFENANCEHTNTPGVPKRLDEYHQERDRLVTQGVKPDERDARLAEKFGFFEIPDKEVVDFHTLYVDLPAALFRVLDNAGPGKPLQVIVRCDSRTQYLGIAKKDLYLMDHVRPFWQNFFKGAIGLWFLLCLVIGVAVTCSTYLSGVIGFLATMFLVLLGLLIEFIKTVAEHHAQGGGPAEAFLRLARDYKPAIPLEDNPMVVVVKNLDKAFEWGLGLVLHLIPNVDLFNKTAFVSEGIDVTFPELSVTGIYLIGYLLPWAVLAYYLMRSREVAA